MHLAWLFLGFLWAPQVSASVRNNKFRPWFPYFDYHWRQVAQDQCVTEIRDFHANNRERFHSPFAAALNCILENSGESIKSNLANSQVVLGLTPTIMSFMGSDIAEVAALSSHHPLLTIILSLGAPGLQIRHIFIPLEVAKIVNKTPSKYVRLYHGWLTNQYRVVRRLFNFGLYALAIGAVTNNITASLYLDSRAVVGFRCGAILMPLAWGLLGLFPALFAMGAVRQQYGLPNLTLRQSGKGAQIERSRNLMKESFEAPRRWICEALFSAAAVAGVLQLFYGTSILSAMTPVSFFDALPIVVRYAASNIVCRALLLVELDRVRIGLHGL
ncbi:hypothetical protein PG997_007249 [Apiospora hydei]|uniref:Uncharacterized protein n=1 Tax=Apiospora hydei TaxID=1337664 RepID=A0ABR1WA95_9PEZI